MSTALPQAAPGVATASMTVLGTCPGAETRGVRTPHTAAGASTDRTVLRGRRPSTTRQVSANAVGITRAKFTALDIGTSPIRNRPLVRSGPHAHHRCEGPNWSKIA